MISFDKIRRKLIYLIFLIILIVIIQLFLGRYIAVLSESNYKKSRENDLINVYDSYFTLKFKEISNFISGYSNWTDIGIKIKNNQISIEDIETWLSGNNVDFCAIFRDGDFLAKGGVKIEKIENIFSNKMLLDKLYNDGSQNKNIVENNYSLYIDDILIIFKISPISNDFGEPLTNGIEIFAKIVDNDSVKELETFLNGSVLYKSNIDNTRLLNFKKTDYLGKTYYVLINPDKGLIQYIFNPIFFFLTIQILVFVIIILGFIYFYLSFSKLYNSLDEKNKQIYELMDNFTNLDTDVRSVRTVFGDINEKINIINNENDTVKQKILKFDEWTKKNKENVSNVIVNINDIIGKINLLFLSVENSLNNSEFNNIDITKNQDTFNELICKSEEIIDMSNLLNDNSQESNKKIDILLQNIKEGLNSSNSIIQILTFIEEISEKTNLLSINASIEASHFGDQGKSFLIIAKEIRELSIGIKTKILNISEHTNKIINSIKNSFEEGKIVQNILNKNLSLSYDNIDTINDFVALINNQIDYLESTIAKLFLSVNIIKEINSELGKQKETISILIDYFDEIKNIGNNISEISEFNHHLNSNFERILPELNQNIRTMDETLNKISAIIIKINLYKNN